MLYRTALVIHAVALETTQQVKEAFVSKRVRTEALQQDTKPAVIKVMFDWALKEKQCVNVWYLLWTLSGPLGGVQGVAGVLQNLTGAAALVLLPTQAAHEEELGGAFSQGRFGCFGQDVAAPLLSLQ